MDRLNVLIVSRQGLHPGYLEDITAVDPRISVKDGLKAFVTELQRKDRTGVLVDRLAAELNRERDRQVPDVEEDLNTMLAQAEVIFGELLFPENLFSRAPRLKWIHIESTGIDRYLPTEIFDGNAIITSSRGAVAIPIAEHVLGFILMLAKNAPRLLSNKQKRRWDRFTNSELRGRTVGIIGLGTTGMEVARLAKGIGMKVIATKRSAPKRESNITEVDELYPHGDLYQMLSTSDFVVIAVPLTMETRKMIGVEELRLMKPTAYLINVARGQIVDQSALIRALREGWIAGAGLDVFETEPLPTDSELWELPNAILSCHIAGWSDKRSQRIIGLFCENLRRYLAGEQLLNVADRQKGY